MMSNILIVDDEKAIADLLEVYLQNENYNVIKYYSSTDVVRDIDNLKIDLAILDVMMPEVDGFKLCSIIRKKYNFPIIFATAKVEDIDKINGLSIGADDYVTKPFEPLELMARVKAQLRRYQKYNKKKWSCLNTMRRREIHEKNQKNNGSAHMYDNHTYRNTSQCKCREFRWKKCTDDGDRK